MELRYNNVLPQVFVLYSILKERGRFKLVASRKTCVPYLDLCSNELTAVIYKLHVLLYSRFN